MAHLAEEYLLECKMKRLESAVTVQRVRQFLADVLGMHWGACDVEKQVTGDGAIVQWTASIACQWCEKRKIIHTHAVIIDLLDDGLLVVSKPEE